MARTFIYGPAGKHIAAEVSWPSSVIRCALLVPTYTFGRDEEYWSDVQASEMSDLVGYVPGGEVVPARSTGYNAAADRTEFYATSGVSWAGLTTTGTLIGWGVLYADTGDPATSPLIQAMEFASQTALTAAPITLTWTSNIVLIIRPAAGEA